jgi:hypothetical protein
MRSGRCARARASPDEGVRGSTTPKKFQIELPPVSTRVRSGRQNILTKALIIRLTLLRAFGVESKSEAVEIWGSQN